jgi:hypothetical protein
MVALLCTAVAIVALLGIPRGVSPRELPLPRVVRHLLVLQLEREQALASEAQRGLPFKVRAVGELVRRVGQAELAQDPAAAQEWRRALRDATRSAAKEHGGKLLLALRALQSELFVKSIAQFEVQGSANPDLQELGGAFLLNAERAGWLARRRVNASADELAALFRIRWTELTGLSDAAAFTPTLNDYRLYYGLRLREVTGSRSRSERIQSQLQDVQALAALDDTYPAAYASGILLFQLGSIEPALESFRAHLRAHPDGEWTLRARNYAAACAERLTAE